jgi:hypothetical protein
VAGHRPFPRRAGRTAERNGRTIRAPYDYDEQCGSRCAPVNADSARSWTKSDNSNFCNSHGLRVKTPKCHMITNPLIHPNSNVRLLCRRNPAYFDARLTIAPRYPRSRLH